VVTLPLMRHDPAFEQQAIAGETSLAARRVLVVEDEVDSAEVLADLLRFRGQDVRMAHDGADALSVAREFRPHAVLLDLGLPTIDGYEVAARLRQEHGAGPLLIAVTGYKADPERLEQAGFDDHVLKPPDLQRVSELLARGREGTVPRR
jgi:two-component system CheB/CheR fusion protein